MSTRPSKPERNAPLAAAVNWSGLAAFLGVRVDQVRTLALVPEEPASRSAGAANDDGEGR